MYKLKSVWMLQALSFGNLILLCGGILYTKEPIIICVSVGIAIVQFLAIIAYQLLNFFFDRERIFQHLSISLPASGPDPVNSQQPTPRTEEELPQEASSGFREPLLSENACETDALINTHLTRKERHV